ncbi:MAG: ATP-binding protein, partial [Acidimicrobiales bacterium]
MPVRGTLAERRVCSVLFVDLASFTVLSEARDPEDVRELLSSYFRVSRTVIRRYGGIVEKFIGDAVMAVWGTPVATEWDTERAVRAALELVAAVDALGGEVGAPGLAARAGVVTGEVAVTLGATGEGMVAGDPVNTAARVQTAAGAGTVLVDAATRRLAAGAIAFSDAGEFELKGKAAPLRLWRAGRVLAGTGGVHRVDGLEAAFIGRDADLRTVKGLFHDSTERRAPRLVVVLGPAGVGKSRLGWELEKYIDGLAETVLWYRGRCLSYGDGVAFWALAQIVRQHLGIAEEETPALAAAKLAEGLVRLVADPAERDHVTAALGRLLGVEVAADRGGKLEAEELFAAWRLFFERLAAVAPVVLVIDDAHHADAGLLNFLDHLVDWTRDLPVFVLLLGRPELVDSAPGFGMGRNRSTLSMDPLDAGAMDAVVEALVPGMPTAARDAITARAEGVPLFAVETIHTLVDAGVVTAVDGVYRLVGDVGTLAVPDSLHGLLAARLDALDAMTRGLVADASVLGSSFAVKALDAISGRPEIEIRAGLSELVRREVLVVSADPLSPEHGVFRFAQEMLRQVAYETLSHRDRKSRHLSVAAHLRRVFAHDGEEIADVVACHYLDALKARPGDGDAGSIRAAALEMLVRAAERADRTGAPGRAAVSYATAAGLIAVEENGTSRSSELYESAARADVTAADYDGAVEHAEAARSAYLEMDDRRGAARVQGIAGAALRRAGRHAEARVELRHAIEVLRPDPDMDTVEVLDALAGLEVTGGNLAEGERLSGEALTLARDLHVEVSVLIGLLITRGFAHVTADRRAEAGACLDEAARLAEQAGRTGNLALALL